DRDRRALHALTAGKPGGVSDRSPFRRLRSLTLPARQVPARQTPTTVRHISCTPPHGRCPAHFSQNPSPFRFRPFLMRIAMSSARRYGSRSRTTALKMEQLEERWVPSVAGAFLETPLVSDQTGVAPITDPDLVNGWGIAMNPASGGFWVSSNGANLTDIYTGDVNGTALAKAGLEVTIPGGAPTGQVFNPTTDFVVASGITNGPAQFITASENGIVTGWNPNVPASSTTAQTAFTASDAAVYKGIALANNGAANFLYLADFHNNKIDVLDSSFHLTTLSGNFT